MNILAIETSCDETAISLVDAQGSLEAPQFTILGNALLSQIDIHKEYGGVFPALAKREHAKNSVPLLKSILKHTPRKTWSLSDEQKTKLSEILEREPELLEQFVAYIQTIEKPDIDVIGVTEGPGLEPALWVGINFARALAYIWNLPLIGINHMEGHIASVLFEDRPITFPSLALLISGGHTELVHAQTWGTYKKIGQTRDDAVGEAFDKVARLMGLPYPGGPKISEFAKEHRVHHPHHTETWNLPRPMLHTKDFDFSFSGLKTAVRYAITNKGKLTDDDKYELAREFEDAVTEVLIKKTLLALEETGAKSLIIGGGVSANTHICTTFKNTLEESDVTLHIPERSLSTDNALMIAAALYTRITQNPALLTTYDHTLRANGTLSLEH